MIKLIQGDCLDVMATLEDGSVDVVITDPPYKLTSGGLSGVCTGGIFDPSHYDNKGKLFKMVEPDEWMPVVYRVMREDSELYTMTNDKNMRTMLNSAHSCGLRLHNVIVWDRCSPTPNRWYMKRCEFILYFWKGRARKINNMGTSALFSIPCKRGDRFHPTEKPVSLMSILIDNATDTDSVILDPFMGGGSTGIACVDAGRSFIGIELDPDYFTIASTRIQSAIDAQSLPHQIEMILP